MSNKDLIEIKKELLRDCPQEMREYLDSVGMNKKRPLGKISPTYWMVEPTRGCNLACDCCTVRLFPKKEYKFMSVDTWEKTISLIKQTTPYTRVDFAQAGEPLLNPNILEILRIGRKISPYSFFEIITNGTALIDGTITYKELFEAGANLIFVDMYAPKEKHYELAEKSGYSWYDRMIRPITGYSAWNYHKNISIKQIVLTNNPMDWNESKKRKGILSNNLNDLDWEAASKMGIVPVTVAPNRRCIQPFRAINVGYDGSYGFCCMDFMRHVYGTIGNVDEGLEGFIRFWLGNYMQKTRKLVANKDRNGHEWCRKCSYTFSRGDIPCWTDEVLNYYWNGVWNKQSINIAIQNKAGFDLLG
jgi:hypothetical protein